MIFIYIAWCAFCWILRGGKFGQICRHLFGFEPGTTWTRIACAALMALPTLDPVLWPSIFLAMTIGYFGESMGLEKPKDYALMALWGLTACTVMLIGRLDWEAMAYAPIGLLVTVAYGINKPLGRRWGLDWTERAELCAGGFFGAAIWFGG